MGSQAVAIDPGVDERADDALVAERFLPELHVPEPRAERHGEPVPHAVRQKRLRIPALSSPALRVGRVSGFSHPVSRSALGMNVARTASAAQSTWASWSTVLNCCVLPPPVIVLQA